MLHFLTQSERGYVMLLTVLLVIAAATLFGIMFIQLGTDIARTSLIDTEVARAQSMADSCAEEAMQQIHDSTPFSGYGELSLGDDTCSYEVIDTGGSNRSIHASSTVRNVVRRVEVVISSINPQIVVDSYQNVATF